MTAFNWVLTEDKFLAPEQVISLMRATRQHGERAKRLGHTVGVRDWFLIDLALSTGLRVMELSLLTCGDLYLDGEGSLLVKRGKGKRTRLVAFSHACKMHCRQYLKWKQSIGESVDVDGPLFKSSNTQGHLTTRALEKSFKRCAARAGLPKRFSIHCLRHTYACELYRCSQYNLRLVQKQLGHSSSKTTEVYANLIAAEVRGPLERMFRSARSEMKKNPAAATKPSTARRKLRLRA